MGTLEIESPSTTGEVGSGEPAQTPRGEIYNDTDSILELFEDRYGYGIDEEEYESESGPVGRAAVYTAPAINTAPITTLALVSNPGGAAPGLANRELFVPQPASQSLIQQIHQTVRQQQQEAGVDGDPASVST